MKRICSLCLAEYPYRQVKKYTHPLQLCEKCQDVLIDLNLTATSLLSVKKDLKGETGERGCQETYKPLSAK